MVLAVSEFFGVTLTTMKRSRNAAYLGYLPHHHKKAKSSRHNDQDDNEPIVDSEEDVIDVNNTFEVELNDGQYGYDDKKNCCGCFKRSRGNLS